jgi:hypothetical protein
MSLRSLLNRTSRNHAARVEHRAVERALSRAVTPESRHELLVLEGSRH